MKISLSKIFEYKQTIETIGEIDQILKGIKQNIPTKISISERTDEDVIFSLFSIEELLENFFVHILITNSNEREILIVELKKKWKILVIILKISYLFTWRNEQISMC